MGKAFTIPSIFTAVDKLTGPVTRMMAKMKEFEKTTKGIKLKEIEEASKKVAKTAAVVGLAIAAPLALAARETMKYQDALASFRTIVSDLSDKDFAKYESAIEAVGKETKRSYIDVAASFEKIAGLNAKFADTAEGISAVSKASILLSKASRQELGPSAESLVGIMNQFSMGAMEADRTINVLAAGTAVGAASIHQTSEAFRIFGAGAKEANLSLEESVSLVQVLSQKQIMGSDAGTALRGTLLKLKASGLGYTSGLFNTRDALVEVNKKYDKLKTAKQKDAYLDKVFGVINSTTGLILKDNIALFDEFTKGVTGTSEAYTAAGINSKTLSERIKNAQAQFQNLSIKVGEMLVPALTKLVDKISPVIERIVDWIDRNPELTKTIVKVAVGVAGLAFAISGIAGAIAIWAKAQLILNAVMMANPIGLVILAIVALIALVVTIKNKWQEWGALAVAVLGKIFPFLALIVSSVQSFRRNWDMITQSFKEGGILSGLKAIGATLLDVILLPLQQILSIIAKVSGFDWAEKAAASIEKLRANIGVNTTTDESGKPLVEKAINPKAVEQDALVQRMEATNNAKVDINIKDPNNRTSGKSDNDFVNIRTTSTMSGGGGGGSW